MMLSVVWLYVVKQKYTTANVVIYSDISLFYYQKFFLLSLCKYTFLLIIITKTQNLIGGQVVHFCLTTYNLNSIPNHSIRSHIYCLNTLSYAILLYNECLQNKYLDDYYKMAIFPPLNAVELFEKHESLFWLRDTFYHSLTNK